MLKTNKKIKKYANYNPYDLLKKLDCFKLPVDLFVVANKMELAVVEDFDIEKIGKEIEGVAFVFNRKPKVWINPTIDIDRKRFVLAHELGHVVHDILPELRKDISYVDDASNLVFQRSGESNTREYNANEFAAQLLMPKDKIVEEIIQYHDASHKETIVLSELVKCLVKKFQVSESAMTVRLIRLRFIK